MAEQGFVYLMACEPLRSVKIGWATDPHKRLDALKTGNPGLKLMMYFAGNRAMESKLHKVLKHIRVSREWFFVDECAELAVRFFLSYLLWSIIETGESAYVADIFKEAFEPWQQKALAMHQNS